LHIILIGSPKSVDVTSPEVTGFYDVCATPGKRWPAQSLYNNIRIRHEPGMTTVPVCERVNRHTGAIR